MTDGTESAQEPEERPSHHVVDCALGRVDAIPFTDAEWDAKKAREEEGRKQLADQAAEHAQLVEAVKGSTDPAVKMLAKRLGIETD